MTTTKHYLEQARAILASGRWIKGVSCANRVSGVRNSSAAECFRLRNNPAVDFCAVGAMFAVKASERAFEKLQAARTDRGQFMANFNDDDRTTLDDVLALYDRAIASCEAT
jgi:hypothetical protein